MADWWPSSSLRRFRAWAALAVFNSCSRTREATRSATWTAWPIRLWAPAAARKDLTGLFTTFSANDPQMLVTIDREKAKAMNVPLSQITTTLSVFMGSEYINDFDYNNRTYRVFVQADQPFRMTAKDLHNFYVRSDSGQMVPLDNLATVAESSGPPVITHYNLFRCGRDRRLCRAGLQLRPGTGGDGRSGQQQA